MNKASRIFVLILFCTTGFITSCEEDNVGIDTDQEPPVVNSTAPENGAVDVPVSISLQATFSEELEPSTVNDNSFIVIFNDSLSVPGTISLNSSMVTFNPDSPLEPNTEFTVTLSSVIEDLNGNHLDENYSWSFTTAAE